MAVGAGPVGEMQGTAPRSKSAIGDHPLLAHPSRQKLFQLLKSMGGACETDLGRLAGIGRNTAKFHLQRLASAELVEFQRVGRRIHYFQSTTRALITQRALVVLQKDIPRRIALMLRHDPMLSWRSIARRLEVTPRAVRWNIERMRDQQLLQVHTNGSEHMVAFDPTFAAALEAHLDRHPALVTSTLMVDHMSGAKPATDFGDRLVVERDRNLP